MFLERIGAGEALYGAFSPYSQQQLILARVAIAQHDQYYLYTENGPAEAELSGALYYRTAVRAALPVTGDWVAARMAGAGEAIIDAVLPRRTCLSRRAAGARNEEQRAGPVYHGALPALAMRSSRWLRMSTSHFWFAVLTAISICGGWSGTWR
jgi:hypothetical protein